MPETLTSWNNASVTSGDVVNQCLFVYNTFQQLTADFQEHYGEVNTDTTPVVQYGYADGSENTIRPTSLTCERVPAPWRIGADEFARVGSVGSSREAGFRLGTVSVSLLVSAVIAVSDLGIGAVSPLGLTIGADELGMVCGPEIWTKRSVVA